MSLAMPGHIAKRIKELKLGQNGQRKHSARALAERICDEFPEYIQASHGLDCHIHLRGNQLLGNYLCRDAEEYYGLAAWSID